MSYLSRTKVGVLRGGPSNEYDVSLKTGSSVLQNLAPERYAPIDILIGRNGVWHFQGKPVAPERVLPQLDVAFIAMHGAYGEDGQIQRLLDRFGVPYTGSRPLASAGAMNKHHAKLSLRGTQIKTPRHVLVHIEEIQDPEAFVEELQSEFPLPFVVKPSAAGSSLGVSVVRTPEAAGPALSAAFEDSDQAIIEDYIAGREATCGVVENFRGERLYALLPVEIVSSETGLYDYDAKYAARGGIHCPGRFTTAESAALQKLARQVHEQLGLQHYSRSDFVVAPDGIYFLEANTLPWLGEGSPMTRSLDAIGCTQGMFVSHLLDQALNKS